MARLAAKRKGEDDRLSPAARKMRFLRTLVCGGRYERAARALGATLIAGVDEVGRGALFGPVVAAAVVLPEGCRIRGLRDSKQLLAPERERLAKIVERQALMIAIEEVDAETIDRVNIYQATRMAMSAAVCRLAAPPDHLLIDAMRLDLPCAQTSIIYGDSLSISIAAASVVAKVYRDRRMCELDREYPQYGLRFHKGYSTPQHKKALAEHGPSPLHRRSFSPVANHSSPEQAELYDSLDLLGDSFGEEWADDAALRTESLEAAESLDTQVSGEVS